MVVSTNNQSLPVQVFYTIPEISRLALMFYVRLPLSLRSVEDLLHERGIDVSHEVIQFWWNRFGPMFAYEIRRRRVQKLRALYCRRKFNAARCSVFWADLSPA